MFSQTICAFGRRNPTIAVVRMAKLAPRIPRTSLSTTRLLSCSTHLSPCTNLLLTPPSARSISARPRLIPPTASVPCFAVPRTSPRRQIQIADQRRCYQIDPRFQNARPLISNETLRRAGRSGNTWTVVAFAVAAGFVFYFSHLETVPVSGRTRFNYYSRDYVKSMAEEQYRLLLHEFEQQGVRRLPNWDPRTQMVRRVMARLVPFSGLALESWEVVVVDDPRTANAFVLPGGKVFVFSGILPVARSESGLAAVLGHEIAHVLADHAGEQLSQSIGTNLLFYSLMLLVAPFGGAPLLISALGWNVLDIAFGRPMSRLQESEADYVGLMMMAEACYDPREAVGFWHRMEQNNKLAPPEWLSTHPSDESRAKKIQSWLPKAMEKRSLSDCSSTTAFAERFRRAMDRGVLMSEPF